MEEKFHVRYRLQLFQIREVNEEIARRANMASTRMGRVQQMLTEQAEHMESLEGMLAQRTLDDIGAQLEEAGRQVDKKSLKP